MSVSEGQPYLPPPPHGYTTPQGQPALTPEQRIEKIGREVRHAQATRWPAGDSWIQGYAEDCGWLLAALAREREATETARYVADCVQVRLTESEGRVRELQEALRLYADERHWDLLPDDRPEATTKPYYPSHSFDGGVDEPWRPAAEALVGLPE